MVIDPVCKMPLASESAAASLDFEGSRVYFCSDACRRRFVANPERFEATAPASGVGDRGDIACHVSGGHGLALRNQAAVATAAGSGLAATAVLLGFYFGALALVSGWAFTVEQFAEFWPFIVTLAIGFGVQVGLFFYLRRAVRTAASGKVIAATGTSSGAAMVSCCTHYLVNLLPALGATGLVSFVGQYQIELFWFGIAANLAGIAFIGRRVFSFAAEA